MQDQEETLKELRMRIKNVSSKGTFFYIFRILMLINTIPPTCIVLKSKIGGLNHFYVLVITISMFLVLFSSNALSGDKLSV